MPSLSMTIRGRAIAGLSFPPQPKLKADAPIAGLTHGGPHSAASGHERNFVGTRRPGRKADVWRRWDCLCTERRRIPVRRRFAFLPTSL